jgi:hypothetical protein
MSLRRLALLTVLATGATGALRGQAPADTTQVTGFLDVYYAWDFNRPPSLDRAYTTQPARHDEFNVNLADVALWLSRPTVHARLALQAGTSVQANYAGEPRVGSVSGPDLSRLLQEAYVGVRATRSLWVDAGVFYSNIGQESWASRDNPTYSRSLIADYSPYYSAGVRALWQATPVLTLRVDLMNGWQTISAPNRGKAVGLRVEYAPAPGVLVGYSDFVGNQQPDSLSSRVRVFNELFARVGPADGTAAWLTADYGTQRTPGGGWDDWYGLALVARRPVSGRVALNARIERYVDTHQVVVASLGPGGFAATGASLGLDVRTSGDVLWRSEWRVYHGDRALFPEASGGLSRGDELFVTSFAVSL